MTENTQALKELCYILEQRNVINHSRSKARYKKSYYSVAANSVKYFNILLKKYDRDPSIGNITTRNGFFYFENNSVWYKLPLKKWLKMGHSALMRKALVHEREYVSARLKTTKLTKKYHNRVMELIKELNAKLIWDNGYVRAIIIKGDNLEETHIGKDRIFELAMEHKLDLGIQELLTRSR